MLKRKEDKAHEYPSDAWEVLSHRLTEMRQKKMESVAAKRTNFVRLIIQDVHNQHNISACLRSAEAFGVQNVHIVSHGTPFKVSGVARGVKNWLTLHHHHSIESCAKFLHDLGYVIAAGMPAKNSVPLQNISTKQPIAVLFGNEHSGVSPEWGQFVQKYFTIPMNGVVESLNISVSAAITMQHLTYKGQEERSDFFLNEQEKNDLLSNWICSQIPSWDFEYSHYKKINKQKSV